MFLDECVVVIIDDYKCTLYRGLAQRLIDEAEARLPPILLCVVIAARSDSFWKERWDGACDVKDAGKNVQSGLIFAKSGGEM